MKPRPPQRLRIGLLLAGDVASPIANAVTSVLDVTDNHPAETRVALVKAFYGGSTRVPKTFILTDSANSIL